MLNFDQKILSKTLAVKRKKKLPFLVDLCQTAHVNGRFIDGSGLFIFVINEVIDLEKLSGNLIVTDFEITFGLINYIFYIVFLKKYSFREFIIDWIK